MALPTISSNSPAAGSIAWTAFGLQYDGVSYSIPAGNTNKKYTWWDYSGTGTRIVSADTLPELAPEDLLLFLNRNGTGVLAPTAQVVDGSLIVNGSIIGDAIAANQIDGVHIKANAITTPAIAAGAVQANNIASGAVTTEKLSVASVGDNAVANGSFEDGTQGWTIFSSGAGASADVVTGVASSGANALRLIRGTSGTHLYVGQASDFYIPVTALGNRRWYFGCRAGALTTGSGFYLRVYWFQADKTTAASPASNDIASNATVSTTWQIFEGQVQPPSNARYARVAFVNARSGSTMLVDEVVAREIIVSAQIGNGEIKAANIDVDELWANTAFVNEAKVNVLSAGSIDGMLITGATIRTAASGIRAEMKDTSIEFYGLYNDFAGAIRGYDTGTDGDTRVAIIDEDNNPVVTFGWGQNSWQPNPEAPGGPRRSALHTNSAEFYDGAYAGFLIAQGHIQVGDNPSGAGSLSFGSGYYGIGDRATATISNRPEGLRIAVIGLDGFDAETRATGDLASDGEVRTRGSGIVAPIGMMSEYAGTTAPEGWLLCQGQAVSRQTYFALFNVIGTAYGAGNGTSTFNLPDRRGRVGVGLDAAQTEFNALGKTGGAKTHTLAASELPAHSHPISYNGGNIGYGESGGATRYTTGYGPTRSGDGDLTTGQQAGTIGQAHNNLQPYQTFNYIIKT